MKQLSLVTSVLLVLLRVVSAADAESSTPGSAWQQLLTSCRATLRVYETGNQDSGQDLFKAGACFGWVDGMLAGHQSYRWLADQMNRRLYCLPDQGIQIIQGVRILVQYLETHRELRSASGPFIFDLAFRTAFPCPSR